MPGAQMCLTPVKANHSSECVTNSSMDSFHNGETVREQPTFGMGALPANWSHIRKSFPIFSSLRILGKLLSGNSRFDPYFRGFQEIRQQIVAMFGEDRFRVKLDAR